VDWNDNSALDLLCGEFDGRIHLFLNVGTAQNPSLTDAGYVQVGGVDLTVGAYSMPFTCDWNDDSLFDLLVGDADGRVSLYLNDGIAGAPHFSKRQFVQEGSFDLTVSNSSAPIWTDLDQDTLPDLVIGDGMGRLRFYENLGVLGAPLFSRHEDLTVGGEPIMPDSYTRPFPIDWDNDGDVDVVTGHYGSTPVLYVNDPAPVVLPDFQFNFLGPLTVPSGGGSVSFQVSLRNPDTQPMSIDVYTTCLVTRLTGSLTFVGPILNYQKIVLASGQTITHTFEQPVPAAAPRAYYDYVVNVGDSTEWIVKRSETFYFMKR